MDHAELAEQLKALTKRVEAIEAQLAQQNTKLQKTAAEITTRVEHYWFIQQKPYPLRKLAAAFSRRLDGMGAREFVLKHCPTLETFLDGERWTVQPRSATIQFDPTKMTLSELDESKKLEAELKDTSIAEELPEDFFK